jgi:hypothetical protein
MNVAEIALPKGVPPSSPPTMYLLATKVRRQVTETIKKTRTEKASSPAGTSKVSPLF